MSFFEYENIRVVTGGEWIRPPSESTRRELLTGVGIDTRDDLTSRMFLAIQGARHDGHAFLDDAVKRGARLLIVERSVDVTAGHERSAAPILQVADTRVALAQLAIHYRRTLAKTTVIAITGSCGKTTTKRLVHGVLSTGMRGTSAPKSFNNDIGVPLTILSAQPDDRYVVVEVGTNAPGEIAALTRIVEPDVAVITMIGRSHLEGLGSAEGVAKEKSDLIRHRKTGGIAIATADSSALRELLPPNAILFGEAEDADLRLTNRGRDDQGWWLEINSRDRFHLALPGKHNALNAIAAIAIGQHMGLSHDQIRAGLLAVQPEAMRMCSQHICGINIFNDAYNANPESVAAALETFAEIAADAPRRIVILGDMLELGADGPRAHAEVAQRVIEIDRRAPVEHVVLVGELSAFTASALSRVWPTHRMTFVDELSPGTLPAVLERLAPGDSVLIKGSRATAMERIIDAIEKSIGQNVKESQESEDRLLADAL